MKKDPVLDAIYKVRRQISSEYPDTDSFLDHYRELEKKYAKRLINVGGGEESTERMVPPTREHESTPPAKRIKKPGRRASVKKDPVLDCIHETRRKIEAEHGHDLKSLLDHYREMEKEHPERMYPKAVSKPKPRKNRSRKS
jgi:hypothetical protein